MNSNQFLKIFESKLGEGVFDLRGILPGKKPSQFFTPSLDEAVTWAEKHADTHNVYFGVLPRDSRKSGEASNISKSSWLWADADVGKKGTEGDGAVLLEKLLRRLPLPPTLIVNSGSGGLHLYWSIEETTKLNEVERANKLLEGLLKTDSVGDRARVLRVVGTKNHKTDPAKDVTLFSYNPDRIYKLEDILAFCKLNYKFLRLIYTGDSTSYDSRSERDFAVVKALARVGCSPEFVKTLFQNTAIGDKAENEPEHYLDFTIEKVFSTETAIEENKWGIVEKDNAYWRVTSDNGLLQLSTFVFEPYVLLRAKSANPEDVDVLLGTVKSGEKTWHDVAFSRRAFNKVDNLTRELPSVEWQWLGKDGDVKKLLPYLLDNMQTKYNGVPTKTATTVIGRHSDLLVLPKQIIGKLGEVDADKAEIKWLDVGREHPKVSFKDTSGLHVEKELGRFLNVCFKLNKIENVVAALGWLVAALHKPALTEQGIHFPVLNIFGTRGSGKSTYIQDVLQRLAGYEKPKSYDANTTTFVMLTLLGSTNNIPVSLSEYRRSSLRSPETIVRYILLGYDGSADSRGRSNQTTQSYDLSAPFTLDGEDPIVDPACLERIIQLNFRPETIGEDSEAFDAFEELNSIDLNAVSYGLHKWALQNSLDFKAALAEIKQVVQHHLPDRVRKNYAVVVAGFRGFMKFCGDYGYSLESVAVEGQAIALNVADLLLPIIQSVVSPETGRTALLVDAFVEDVINHIALNEGPDMFIFRYNPDKNSLYLHLTGAYNWWARTRNAARQPVLEQSAIKNQLSERLVADGNTAGPGMYVTFRGNKDMGRHGTMRVYEINLDVARDTGLEIPGTLEKFAPRIKVGTELKELD